MDENDIRDLVERSVSERISQTQSEGDGSVVLPIQRFDAVDDDGIKVNVIGVQYRPELQFLVITEEDGEIWPALRERVFRDESR